EEHAPEARAEQPTREADVPEVVVDDLEDRSDGESLEADERDRKDEPEGQRPSPRRPHAVGRGSSSHVAHRAPAPPICTSSPLLKVGPPEHWPVFLPTVGRETDRHAPVFLPTVGREPDRHATVFLPTVGREPY